MAASTAPAGTAVFTVAWRSASHVAPHRETGHTTRRGDAFLVPLADIQQCQSLQVHQVASADFDVRWSAPMTAPVPASFIALPPLPQRCSSVDIHQHSSRHQITAYRPLLSGNRIIRVANGQLCAFRRDGYQRPHTSQCWAALGSGNCHAISPYLQPQPPRPKLPAKEREQPAPQREVALTQSPRSKAAS